jgi:hypothetical protein
VAANGILFERQSAGALNQLVPAHAGDLLPLIFATEMRGVGNTLAGRGIDARRLELGPRERLAAVVMLVAAGIVVDRVGVGHAVARARAVAVLQVMRRVLEGVVALDAGKAAERHRRPWK